MFRKGWSWRYGKRITRKDYKRKSRWSIQAGLGMISAREYKESIAECTAGVKKKNHRGRGIQQIFSFW